MGKSKKWLITFLLAESQRLEIAARPFLQAFSDDDRGSLYCLELARQVQQGRYLEAYHYLAKKGLLH